MAVGWGETDTGWTNYRKLKRRVLQEKTMVPVTVPMSVLAIPGTGSHEEMSARGKK